MIKLIHIQWEGRGYGVQWRKDIEKIQKLVGDGPFFEYTTETGGVFATGIPSVGDIVESHDDEPVQFKIRPLDDDEDPNLQLDWREICGSEHWVRHASTIDYLLNVIKELSTFLPDGR